MFEDEPQEQHLFDGHTADLEDGVVVIRDSEGTAFVWMSLEAWKYFRGLTTEKFEGGGNDEERHRDD